MRAAILPTSVAIAGRQAGRGKVHPVLIGHGMRRAVLGIDGRLSGRLYSKNRTAWERIARVRGDLESVT